MKGVLDKVKIEDVMPGTRFPDAEVHVEFKTAPNIREAAARFFWTTGSSTSSARLISHTSFSVSVSTMKSGS